MILPKKKITRKEALFIITTLADIGSLFMAFFYIVYVALMMILGVGPIWLNSIMIGITVLYCWFVFFKIIYLNRVMQRAGRVKRIVKMSSKYTRFVLRIINAVFVILTLVGTQFWENVDFRHVLAIIGIVVMCISLFLSIVLDIWSFMIRLGLKHLVATRAMNKQQQLGVENEQVAEAYGEEVNT